MTPVLKISSIAVVGTSVATGVGALVVKGLETSKEKVFISSLLSKDPSRRSIASGESDDGTKAGKAYKDLNKDIGNLNNSGDSVPETFKTACKNKLDLQVEGTDSGEYKDFLNYCTRFTLVSDLIKENGVGKELLVKGNGNEQEWISAWTLYVDDNRNKIRTKNGDIGKLKDWDSKNSQKSTVPETFMVECEANFKKPFYDVKGDLYLDTLKFCTKAKVAAGVVGGG